MRCGELIGNGYQRQQSEARFVETGQRATMTGASRLAYGLQGWTRTQTSSCLVDVVERKKYIWIKLLKAERKRRAIQRSVTTQ